MSLPPRLGQLVIAHRSERSILDAPDLDAFPPYVVMGRSRRATCSGVAWLHNRHLAAVNLYGQHLRIYRFDGRELALLHEVDADVPYPESVAASSDGRRLAITHSLNETIGVTLRSLDPRTLLPGPAETIRPALPHAAFHGVAFSADSHHLAFTTVGEPAGVEVLNLGSRARTAWLRCGEGLSAKSVAFSADGCFAAIAEASSKAVLPSHIARDGAEGWPSAQLAVYRFDASTGALSPQPVIARPVADLSLGLIETIAFMPAPGAGYRFVVTDQAQDQVRIFDFDPRIPALTSHGLLTGDVSFPHGVDVSADGGLVAVSGYGDDRLSIFEIRQG